MDVIQIPADAFLERRNIASIDKDVALVQELVTKYYCFQEAEGGGPPPPSVTRRDPHYTKRAQYHSHNKHHRHHAAASASATATRHVKVLSFEDKVRREIQGIMNKIASANMNAILKRFNYMMDEKSIDIILEAIMTKCYMHDEYLSCYIVMIKHIHERFPEHVTARARMFFDTFLNELGSLTINEDVLTNDDYDAFCLFVKTKKHLYGKHKTVLSMMLQDGLLPAATHMDMYFDFIMTFITAAAHDRLHQKIEVGATLLSIFFKVHPHDHARRLRVSQLYDSVVRDVCTSKKTQFLFLQVCECPNP